ncbi:MAG: hypothetical protein ACQGVK_04175 [Myxococcota bacterium]
MEKAQAKLLKRLSKESQRGRACGSPEQVEALLVELDRMLEAAIAKVRARGTRETRGR